MNGVSKLGIIAGAGWALFVISIIYGITVYGPNQYKAGAISGAKPVVDSSMQLPDGSPVVPGQSAFVQSTSGTVSAVSADSISVEMPDPGHIGATFVREMKITSDTKIIKVTLVNNAGQDAQENQEVGGLINETPISIDQVQAGSPVSVEYQQLQDNSYEAISIRI